MWMMLLVHGLSTANAIFRCLHIYTFKHCFDIILWMQSQPSSECSFDLSHTSVGNDGILERYILANLHHYIVLNASTAVFDASADVHVSDYVVELI